MTLPVSEMGGTFTLSILLLLSWCVLFSLFCGTLNLICLSVRTKPWTSPFLDSWDWWANKQSKLSNGYPCVSRLTQASSSRKPAWTSCMRSVWSGPGYTGDCELLEGIDHGLHQGVLCNSLLSLHLLVLGWLIYACWLNWQMKENVTEIYQTLGTSWKEFWSP